MIDLASVPDSVLVSYRQQSQVQLESLRNYRLSWWTHWARLAELFCPRRYKWFITPNNTNRGNAINQAIVDETGVLALRTLKSGLMAGLTSPTKPWFKFGLHDLKYVDYGPVKTWLAECERRVLRVLSESNFYAALGQVYEDVGLFGSAAMIIYEDFDDVIRCYNPCLGEFFFGASDRLDINVLAREFTYTVRQAVERFTLECVSESTRQLYKTNQMATEVIIQHIIEPNTVLWESGTEVPQLVPSHFKFREVYWEMSQSNAGRGRTLVQACGFNEKPFVGARWDTCSNDAYGRSPGMDALPANAQVQIEQKRKGQAIDKNVNPPMNASVNMKNEPMSILPGAINYVTDIEKSGFAPAYKMDLHLQDMREDISEVQARIKSIFFVDLFMMISELDTVRTATEIDARREEKLIQLGPVIERFENEVLDEALDRIFSIMVRRGLIPPPPQEIAGAPLNISYISMLAEAQRAASTTAIERLAAFAGNLFAVDQSVMDNLDLDKMVDLYADLLNTNPEVVRPMAQVIQIRAVRAKQISAQQQLAALGDAANAGKTLSETDVGGGQNALQRMVA